MLRPLAVLTLSAFAISASAEDVTITYKMGDGAIATHYFAKDHIRFNSGRSDVIMEFASGKIVNIDHQKKQFSEMTVAEMETTMKAASAQMEQAMAQMPPQLREKMGKMMGGGSEVSVTKGATKTVAGVSCQSYSITMGDTMTQETCNSTAIVPPFDPGEFKKLAFATAPMGQGMSKMVEKMSEIHGMALSTHTTISVMGRKNEVSMEATEIKKGAIAADVFALPEGYKKVESPLKAMSKMGGPR